MVDVFGFLARECGWSHDFILDNFTVDQIYTYYGSVQREVMRLERLRALSVGEAVAYGFGNKKAEEFNEFLEQIHAGPRKSVDRSLEEMKDMGLPVEDGNG